MNTDNDYDEDGNNIVPCPICLNVHCASKEGGKCPEEDKFVKAMTTPETMRGKETEIREAWMKETWITEYHDRKDIADWWLAKLEAQRTADLEAILEGVEKLKDEGLVEIISPDLSKFRHQAIGYQQACADTLSLIEQIMNKKI